MNGWCGSTATQRVFQIPQSLLRHVGDRPLAESIHGRWEPKTSMEAARAKLQVRLGMWLVRWAKGCGEVGTDWRCYLLAGETRPSSLVPDVSYLSYRRWPKDLPMDARQRPRTAPDIAVEILSTDEARGMFEEKVRLYLEHGTSTVIAVNVPERTIGFYREDQVRMMPAKGCIPVPGFGDLFLDGDALFEDLGELVQL